MGNTHARRRRSETSSFLRRELGGAPYWLIAVCVITFVLIGAVLIGSQLSARDQPKSDAVYTPVPLPTYVVHRAVMFGDSYFTGLGTVKQKAALGYATARALGYEPIIRGTGATGYVTQRGADKKGGVAGTFVEQLAADTIDRYGSVELVVVNGGLADRSATAEVFAAGMRQLISDIREQQPSAKVVILGPPNVTPAVEASGIDQLERDTSALEQVDYISFDQIMAAAELRPLISTEDNTHPVADAVPEIVARFAEQLRAIGVTDYRAN